MIASIDLSGFDDTENDTSLVIQLIAIVFVILNVILFMFLLTLVESKL